MENVKEKFTLSISFSKSAGIVTCRLPLYEEWISVVPLGDLLWENFLGSQLHEPLEELLQNM